MDTCEESGVENIVILRTENMELRQQVCNLELSQKLKELGVPQESLFSWYQERAQSAWCDLTYQKDVPWIILWSVDAEVSTNRNRFFEIVSAFTASELGEMLKKNNSIRYDNLGTKKNPSRVHVDLFRKYKVRTAPTEADARAKCLIYLIENDLVDVKSLTLQTNTPTGGKN